MTRELKEFFEDAGFVCICRRHDVADDECFIHATAGKCRLSRFASGSARA